MSRTVQLYRYDLTNGMAAQMAPMLIGRPLEGIWHTSIVMDGTEFYFDGGVGIVSGPAGATRFGPPLRSEVLGHTDKTTADLEAWNAAEMRANRFGPDCYNLMLCNCNHYTQAASQFLMQKDIPDDVRLMIPTLLNTPLGRMIGPMIQQMVSSPTAANHGVGAAFPFANLNAGAQPSAAAAAAPHATAPHLDADTQESLDIYIALIVSDDDAGVEKKRTTLEALDRILSNISNYPSNPQYRRLSLTSEFYKTRVAAPFECAAEVLLLAGFAADDDGTHLRFDGDAGRLRAFITAIKEAASGL